MSADQMFYVSTERTKVNQFNLRQGAWRLDYQGEHHQLLAEEECGHHRCTLWWTDVGVLDLLGLYSRQMLNFEGSCNIQSFLNILGMRDYCREYVSAKFRLIYIDNDYFNFNYFGGAFMSLLSTVQFIRLFLCCRGRNPSLLSFSRGRDLRGLASS